MKLINLLILIIINWENSFAKQTNEILKSHNLATKLFEYLKVSNTSDKCKITAQFHSQNLNESWAIECKYL